MFIEPHRYLRAVLRDFRIAGGGVVVGEIADVAQLAALAEPVIVNCTGMGARDLFGDDSLIPIKGQLVVLRPQPGIDYLTILSAAAASRLAAASTCSRAATGSCWEGRLRRGWRRWSRIRWRRRGSWRIMRRFWGDGGEGADGREFIVRQSHPPSAVVGPNRTFWRPAIPGSFMTLKSDRGHHIPHHAGPCATPTRYGGPARPTRRPTRSLRRRKPQPLSLEVSKAL